MPAAVRRRAGASAAASGSQDAEGSHSAQGVESSRDGAAAPVPDAQLCRLASIELSGTPSVMGSCVALSPAGQAAFVSPAAIHVLTPAWTLAPLSDTSAPSSRDLSMRLLPGLEVPTLERSAALSCAAYTAIRIDPLLAPARDDHSTGRALGQDYAAFPVGLDKLGWKAAAWSPQPFGSLNSPLLAALDSSLRVSVFHAKSDPVRGPYEVRDYLSVPGADKDAEGAPSRKDFLRRQITCMTWLPSTAREQEHTGTAPLQSSCHLLAATRLGELLLWRFAAGRRAEFVCSTQAAPKAVCGLSVGQWTEAAHEQSIRIAMQSVSSVHTASVSCSADGTLSLSSSSASFAFAHQSALSAWAGDALYLASPGALHRWVPGAPSSHVELGADDAGRGDRLSPAASLVATHDGLDLVLADGLQYHVKLSHFSARAEALLPTKLALPKAHLAAIGHAVHDLQASYEAEQGLWALSGPAGHSLDGQSQASLRWAVHRADTLGQFRYARHPALSATLLLSLPAEEGPFQPSERATALLRHQTAATAWNSAARFAPLLAYYYALPRSARASVVDAVHREVEARRDAEGVEELQGVVWLSTWLASQSAESSRANIVQTLDHAKRSVIRANLRSRLQRIIGALNGRNGRADTHESASYYKRTAALGLLASTDGSDAQMRSQASKLLQSFLTKAQAKATEQAWTAQAQTDAGIDTGETCPVCSASVALSLQYADLAKCASGHIWSRCSVTLRLLETGARSCGWCGAQAALAPPELRDTGDHNAAGEAMELDAPEQHQEGSELSELKRQTRCGICGGPWCVLGG